MCVCVCVCVRGVGTSVEDDTSLFGVRIRPLIANSPEWRRVGGKRISWKKKRTKRTFTVCYF